MVCGSLLLISNFFDLITYTGTKIIQGSEARPRLSERHSAFPVSQENHPIAVRKKLYIAGIKTVSILIGVHAKCKIFSGTVKRKRNLKVSYIRKGEITFLPAMA